MSDSHATPAKGLAARTAPALGLVVLAALLVAFFWYVSHGVLVMFAAVVFAVVLDGLTGLLRHYARLPRGLALALTIVVIGAGVGALFWTSGVRVANQGPELRQSLEQSIGQLRDLLHQMGVNPQVLGSSTEGGLVQGAITYLLTSQASISETVSFATDLLVIVVAGIYFAVSPRFYTETVMKLFPLARRNRLREVQAALANALRRWVAGRFTAMLAVGVMTTIGLLLLDVRLALLLGFIAGALTFIPYLGTVISLIPATLIGLLNGPATALYVMVLYLGAHLVEGYLLTPLIQEEAVHIPPSWLIMAQLFGLLLAGVFGMAMATPVAVVVTIAVQMLYVQDVLGDHVRLLGK